MLKLFTTISILALSSAAFLTPSNVILATTIPNINTAQAILVEGDFKYTCSEWETFVHANYLKNNANFMQSVCNKVEEGEIYRLDDGANLIKKANTCTINEATTNPTKVLCASTNPKSWLVTTEENCPANYTLMNLLDAKYKAVHICQDLRYHGESVIIDSDSYISYDYDRYVGKFCLIHEGSSSSNKLACVIPGIERLVIKSANSESSCPKGQSLVTIAEVKADLESYCQLLKEGEVARLAGGGSLSNVKGCKALHNSPMKEDNGNLGLCAPEDRKLK